MVFATISFFLTFWPYSFVPEFLNTIKSENCIEAPKCHMQIFNAFAKSERLYNLSNITGNITTASNLPVNCHIKLFKDGILVESVYSNSFNFSVAPGDYELCLFREGTYLDGVSTADIVTIQRHILGIVTLDSNVKHISADVNNTSTITASDISHLRRLILGVTSKFSNAPSWIIVPNDTLPALNNQIDVNFFKNYCRNITVNGSESITIDFTAIKMGDVTLSAMGN